MTTSDDSWFPLRELTRRLAGLAWVEERVGGIYDAWAMVELDDRSCALFATSSRHHLWHAEVVRGELAIAPALSSAAALAPPSAEWNAVAARLDELVDPGRTTLRLAAAVRHVEPWLARETEALLAHLRSVADDGLARWLNFIELDHHGDASALAAVHHSVSDNTVDLHDRAVLASLELRAPSQRVVRPN